MPAGDGSAVGSGVFSTIDVDTFDARQDRAERIVADATRRRRHLWAAVAVFVVRQPGQDDPTILDSENLLGWGRPFLGCYLCEQEYAPGLEHTTCAGMAAE